MFAFREQLRADTDELAALVIAEHGKTLRDAAGEIRARARGLRVQLRAPPLAQGRASVEGGRGVDTSSMRHTLGVLTGITPFNIPVMVPFYKAPVALAAGNAFVLKPSETDPSPSLLMSRLWAEAGLQDGAFTVLHGDRVAVDALLTHSMCAPCRCRLDAGRAPCLRDGDRVRQAHASARRARSNTRSCCRTPTRRWPPTRSPQPFGSAGQRCMAISVPLLLGADADAEAVAAAPGSGRGRSSWARR